MKPLNIHFLGSDTTYSKAVKKALIKAGYKLTDSPKGSDLLVVASYGHKIPQDILSLPKYGSLNIHPSLLPKYRGATPVPSAILSKESITGVSIIKMSSKIDVGPILSQEKVKIKPKETSESLLNRCFILGAKMLIKLIPDFIEHKITPIPQPTNSPTPYTKKFTKKDGFIPWDEFIKASKTNFTSIDHQIRAFYPWPGVHTTMPNNKTLKLLPNNLFQLEGKSPISWQQLLNGYQHLLK